MYTPRQKFSDTNFKLSFRGVKFKITQYRNYVLKGECIKDFSTPKWSMCVQGYQSVIRISTHGVWIWPWKIHNKKHENVLKFDFRFKIFCFWLLGHKLDILSGNYFTFWLRCNEAFNPHTLYCPLNGVWCLLYEFI